MWRYLIDDDVAAAAGLAGDEAAMLFYGRGETPLHPATLRLYTYRSHCALVGRYQSLEDEVDLAYCSNNDVEVGRRPTGGGAIIMGRAQLGVALTARADPEETPRQALIRYAGGVVAGLRALGVEASFRSKNDLEVGGRKIAGLGLYLDPRGAVLFHASVLVDLDVGLMLRILRIPGAKVSDKAVSRIEDRVTTLSRELASSLTAADIRAPFGEAMAEGLGARLEQGTLELRETERRDSLESRRYGAKEWVAQRSPRRDARGSSALKTPVGFLRIYAGVHGGAIKSVLVAGDFNLLPPGVARLEAALKWCRAEPEAIVAATRKVLGPEELGVPPEALAEAVWTATARALDLERQAHPKRLEGSCYFPEPGAEGEGAPRVEEEAT